MGEWDGQWRIQTGDMGCRKPMKTANNLIQCIQYINFFFLAKTATKAMILFSAEVMITLCKFVRTHIKQVVSRPAAEVTGYLPLEINYGDHRLTNTVNQT